MSKKTGTKKELLEKRAQAVAELRSANEAAAAKGRNLTDADRETWENAKADVQAYNEALKRLEETEQFEALLDGDGDPQEIPAADPKPKAEAEPSPQPQASNEIDVDVDFFPGRVDPRASAEYHQAFARALVLKKFPSTDTAEGAQLASRLHPSDSEFGEETMQAMAELQVDNPESGGWLVMSTRMRDAILQDADDNLWLRRLGSGMTVPVGTEVGQLYLAKDFGDFEWSVELQEPTNDDLGLGKRKMKANPLQKEVLISRKLMAAAGRKTMSLVRARLSYRYNTTLEYAGWWGTGRGQYLGMMVPSDDGIPVSRDTEAGFLPNKVNFEGIFRAIRGVPSRWRSRPGFGIALHDDVVTELLLEKDGDGKYLFIPRADGDPFDRILNKRVYESWALPSTMVPGAYVGLVGDFSWWHYIDESTFLIQPHDVFIRKGLRGFIAMGSSDGGVQLPEAFRRMKLPTA